jgi:hypothetical protein
MRHYRPSSELQRTAEQALRNRRRLAIWRKRYWQHLDEPSPGVPLNDPKQRPEDGARHDH